MDRFRFCSSAQDFHQASGCNEESSVLLQRGVTIYNGMQRTRFTAGNLQLTTHRLIWSPPLSPANASISLPLGAISTVVLLPSGGLMSTASPKLSLKLISSDALLTLFQGLLSPPHWADYWTSDCTENRIDGYSNVDFIRLGFAQQGHKEFERALNETLKVQCWLMTDAHATASGRVRGTGGILAIERQLAAKATTTDRSISEAFEDLSRLMTRAGEMVEVCRLLANKVNMIKRSGGAVQEDETTQLRMAMLSMGMDARLVVDSHSSSPTASSFHGQIARQVSCLLAPLLRARLETGLDTCQALAGGCIDLASAYCRVNRARGVDLISPEDLLQAGLLMEPLNLPLRLKQFPTGVMIFQLASESEEATLKATLKLVETNTSLSAGEVARLAGIPHSLARERLLSAEERGLLCRDDSEKGLTFFPNLFETRLT